MKFFFYLIAPETRVPADSNHFGECLHPIGIHGWHYFVATSLYLPGDGARRLPDSFFNIPVMNEKDKPRPQHDSETADVKRETNQRPEDKQEGRMSNGETGGATADIHESDDRSNDKTSKDIY